MNKFLRFYRLAPFIFASIFIVVIFTIPWSMYRYVNAASIYSAYGLVVINLGLILNLFIIKRISPKEINNFRENIILLGFQILAAVALFIAAAIRHFYG